MSSSTSSTNRFGQASATDKAEPVTETETAEVEATPGVAPVSAAPEAVEPAPEPAKVERIQARCVVAGGNEAYGDIIEMDADDKRLNTRFVAIDPAKVLPRTGDTSTDEAMAALASQGAADGEGDDRKV